MLAISASVAMVWMRALACASMVRMGNCQPSQLRAGVPTACSASARRPEVICSPADTTTSYSAGSWSGLASRQYCTSRSVSPAIADTTTATSLPASTSPRTSAATLRIRSLPAIDVPPNFMTIRAKPSPCTLTAASARLV